MPLNGVVCKSSAGVILEEQLGGLLRDIRNAVKNKILEFWY